MAIPEFTTDEIKSEEWRPVTGFESLYSISNLGRVKSYHSDRLLKPCVFSGRYMFVGLCKNGDMTKRTVHGMVASAFIGPRPRGFQVNHKDGDKRNNRASNLEYVTPKANTRHAVETGLFPKGERHWTKRHPELLEDRRGKNHWVHQMPDRKSRLFGGTQPAPETKRGSANGFAKLDEQKVREIRAAYGTKRVTLQALADRYGVGITTISAIIRRQNWAWLD